MLRPAIAFVVRSFVAWGSVRGIREGGKWAVSSARWHGNRARLHSLSLPFIALARGDTGTSSRGAPSPKCHGCSAFDQRRSHVGTRRFFRRVRALRLISRPLPGLIVLPLQKSANPLISHNFRCGITATH